MILTGRAPNPLRVLVLGDSMVCGRTTAGVTQTIPYVLRTVEELRLGAARRGQCAGLPEIRWVGTETGSDSTSFHLSNWCGSNAVSGRAATHFVNGTSGAPTIAALFAAIAETRPNRVVLEVGHNDVGVLDRTVAQAVADLTTLASQILAIDSSIIIHPAYVAPSLVNGYSKVADLQAYVVANGIPGCIGTPWDMRGLTTSMVVDPTDGHPSIPASPTTAAGWTSLDPATKGVVYLGGQLFKALYGNRAIPGLSGEAWT